MAFKLEAGSLRGLEEVMGLASRKKFTRKLHIKAKQQFGSWQGG